jgi:phage gpG-like protein
MIFEVKYTGANRVDSLLRGLEEAVGSPVQRAILRKVGAAYLSDTENRFSKEYDPDRKKWKELRDVTVRMKKHGDKRREPGIMGPTHRGVWTGDLATSLKMRFDGDSVIIGSDVEYAPWFHYGVKKLKKIGQNRTVPWGPIPPRRFLGRNNRIDKRVMGIIQEELAKKIGSTVKSAGRDL